MAHGTAYKSVIKNAAYIFLIKLFPALALLAITILYSRQLPEADYGDYQNFTVKLILLGTVAYAGLPVTLITYSADVIKHLSRQLRVNHILLYLGWLVYIALVFAYLQNKGLHLSWVISAGLLIMYVVHAVQEALVIAAKNMKGLVVFNLLFAAYFLLIHINALENYNLEQLLIYLLAGMIMRGIGMSVIIHLSYKAIKGEPSGDISLDKVRNLWLHLGLYDLFQNIFRFIDKFILSILLTSGLYAIYFNGAQEIPIFPYLLGAVSSSVLVQLAGNRTEGDNPHRLMYESGKLLACIVFPLFFFLLFFSRELFIAVFTEKYLASVPIFIMTLFVLPLRAYNYTTILQHFHRGALINKGALVDLSLALIMMYPLYYVFGLPGIVLSFVLSTYIQVGFYLHHTSRILSVPVTSLLPLKNWLVKLLVFGVFLFVLHHMLCQILSPRATLIMGGIWTMIIGATVFFVEWKNAKRLAGQ